MICYDLICSIPMGHTLPAREERLKTSRGTSNVIEKACMRLSGSLCYVTMTGYLILLGEGVLY